MAEVNKFLGDTDAVNIPKATSNGNSRISDFLSKTKPDAMDDIVLPEQPNVGRTKFPRLIEDKSVKVDITSVTDSEEKEKEL